MQTSQRSGQKRELHSSEYNHKGTSKGLRIGNVVFPVFLILVIAVMSWALHVKPDPDVQRLLSSTPVAERLHPYRARFATVDNPKESPLVIQATAFARLINPPKPIKPSDSQTVKQTDSPPPKPSQSSPKFTLHATTVYPSEPHKSMALICEPGLGFQWVKPGARIEHLVIDQIRTGMIVYRDGERLGEVAMDKTAIAPKIRPKVEHADSLDSDRTVLEESKPSTRVAANVDRMDGQVKPAASVPFRKVSRTPLGPGR